MILGLGTDVVEIARMRLALTRRGEALARRILAAGEWPAYQASADPPRLLAKRFAVKEAAVKALGTGFRDGIALGQISVGHDPLGRPLLCWQGAALERARALGMRRSHLSLADERNLVVATVIIEGG